jgi:hypothetical protein
LSRPESLTSPDRYQGTFFLCERGKEVKDERINVSAQFGDHKRYPMSHEAANEVNISAEAVQLGYGDVAFELLGGRQSCPELRAAVHGI